MQVNNSQIRDNTEKTILALLLSRKGGCSLSQLLGDYYETEGEQLPWKSLGYLSPLSFLQSMYKSVRVEYRNDTPFIKGIASDKSKHISKLVAGQKNIQKYPVGRKSYRPSHYYPNTGPLRVRVSAEILAKVIGRINQNPDGIDKDCLLRYVQSEMPHVNIVMSDLEEQLRELSHKIYQTRNKVFPNRRESTNLDSADRVLVTAGGNEDSDNLSDYDEENDFNFIPSGYIPPCTSAKTKATSSFIKDSVSKCQDRVVECETVEYTSRVQVDQNSLYNFHNYNYDTQVETQRQTNGDVDKKSTSSDDENVEILVSKRVRFRLEKLIENSPDGIWCADLPQKYLQEYRISLNYTELGFNSVREFASHLPDIFHCVQPYDTGDFMLYYAKREIPTDKQKGKQKIVNLAELHNIYNTDDQIEALPTSLSLDTCKKLIPDDIVTIGESVGQLDVTEFANADKPYIEVIVVEVFTPSFFWIQLRKKQQMFKSFMDELHNFYVLKHHDYIMPPVVLEKGLNCACMYNNIWHRGIIKTVRPDLQVTVMFYDYGTLKTYPPEAIHYLHRMFSAIPAQAIPCGLINTRPYKGSKWSSNATHNFAVRTSQIPLIATIASINTEDNSMLVTLTDTLEEEDVHINDWLVEKKLAQHGKMVCMKTRNFPFRYYLECQERAKQKSNTRKISKTVETIKCARSRVSNNYFENKVALYDTSVDLELSSENNSIPHQKKSFQLEQNSSSIEQSSNSTLDSKQNSPRNLKRLYETLLKLRQSSRFNSNDKINNNAEETESTNSSLVSNKKYKPNPFRESLNVAVTSLASLNDNGISKVSSETEYETSGISEKKRSDVPLAETCFLNIVRNSVHFAVDDKDIRWSSTGNVSETQDSSSLIVRNVQRRMASRTKQKVIAIPRKVLEIMTEKKSSIECTKSSTSISRVTSGSSPSSCLSQGRKDDRTVDDSNRSIDGSDIFRVENPPSKTIDDDTFNLLNCYLCTSTSTWKKKVLQMLSTRDTSSDSSDLDSDDLDEESQMEESDGNINQSISNGFHSEINANRCLHSIETDDTELNGVDGDGNESYEKLVSTSTETSVKTNRLKREPATITEEQPSLNESIDESKETEDEALSIDESKETEDESKETEDKALSIDESKETEDEALSIDESKETEDKALSIDEATCGELVPMHEFSSPDTESETSSTPIFNDTCLESNEEEWDVVVSFTGMHQFLKTNCPFYNNIKSLLDDKSNESLKITEVNDSNSSEDTNKDVYSTDRMIDDTEYSYAKSEKLIAARCEESAQTQLTVAQDESNVVQNNEASSNSTNSTLIPWKSQGKGKTLFEMLNKMKLLQNKS